MLPIQRKFQGLVTSSQTREIMTNVCAFMTRGADAGAPTNLKKTLKRVAEATGVSGEVCERNGNYRIRCIDFVRDCSLKGDLYHLTIQRWTSLINVLRVWLLMTFILLTRKNNAEKNSCEAGPVNQVYNEPINFKKSATEIRF
jgi:hypothetical protein